MTTEEFSNEFDLAVNAYLPGGDTFDEYEKSAYLTKAQKQVVLQLYNSFEQKEIVREFLAPLIRTAVIKNEYTGEETDLYAITDLSHFYELPDDLWLITFEEVVVNSNGKCLENKRLSVSPTTQDKLSKVMGNPFKGPNDNRALRLNIADNIVEIIAKYDLKRYIVRYIKKLEPIILTRLTDGTSIDGKVERTECELHESLHQDILNIAVAMALQTRRAIQQQPVKQPEQQQNQEQNV